MKIKGRFDLEQEILKCWEVTNDINDVYQYVITTSKGIDDDDNKVANILLGISQLYDLKFQKLFNTFEELIKNKKL
jgi:hypothetical protein